MQKRIFIIDGKRTPFVKAGTLFKDVATPDLGAPLVRHLLDRHRISDALVSEVIVGNVGAMADYPNIARVVSVWSGLGVDIPALTVHRNCGSGMEAIYQAFVKIRDQGAGVILAGGVEKMSAYPYLFQKTLKNWWTDFSKTSDHAQKIAMIFKLKAKWFLPVDSLQQGLVDPFLGESMGQICEHLGKKMKISRSEQDSFAHRSHLLAFEAQSSGHFLSEISPVIGGDSSRKIVVTTDNGVRNNSSLEKLNILAPIFDPDAGSITVGNSCQISDGGAMALLASEERKKELAVTSLAEIKDYQVVGVRPEEMGIGPYWAIQKILRRNQLNLSDIDLIEINEAFAVQVLANIKMFKDESLLEKTNVSGGAIGIGHPIGASGAKIVISLAHELKRRQKRLGIAAICIGGGMGAAMLIENSGE